MESIKNNTKYKEKRIEIHCLRTVINGGHAGHRPLRNITIEH